MRTWSNKRRTYDRTRMMDRLAAYHFEKKKNFILVDEAAIIANKKR